MNAAGPLLLLVGALILLEIVVLVRAHPEFGLWLVMGVSVLDYSGLRIEIETLGYQIYAIDIIIVVLALITIERRLTDEPNRPGFGVVAALFIVALARGLPIFGPETAVNASRIFLYLLVAIGFASICDISIESVQRVWIAGALVVGVQAVGFWVENGFGTYAPGGSRAMTSSQALLVSQAALFLLARRTRKASQLGVFLLLAVAFSQQRTVWAATLVSVLIGIVVLDRIRSIEGLSQFKGKALAIGVLIAALVIFGPSDAGRSFSYATSNISTESGTFGWRIEGWIDLIRSFLDASPINQLVGQPFGTGYERRIGIGVVDTSPHNMYVLVLTSLGVVGTVAFFILFGAATRRALRVQNVLGPLICGLWVFSIGYEIPTISGVLIGVALSRSFSSRPHQLDHEDPLSSRHELDVQTRNKRSAKG